MNFPLLEKQTKLGRLSNPKIPVSLKTRFGFRSFSFLLDTGADFTMLPASLANSIGLNLSALRQTKLYGIEGRGVTAFVSPVTLRIGRHSFEVLAFLSPKKETPLILGRQGLFNRFNIKFDNRKKVIVLTPL